MTHPIQTATLCRSVSLSDQTKHLEFRVDNADEFPFMPGQFVSIREPLVEGKHVTRAYSIASAPRSDEFHLCLNRVIDGKMSNFLCDLSVGSHIRFHGPHGLFTLREPLRDSLLIATGTGVAPFRSMAHWLFVDSARHCGREIYLIYGTRYETDVYYEEEFRDLEKLHPNFHYFSTLSRGGEAWTGLRGYVQEYAKQIVTARANNGIGLMHAYICGLQNMVDANRELLFSLGWDKHDVIYERYD
jgi:ferredoxin-NADP reductase